VKQITGDFIKSNNISVGKYISEKHLELYFQTRTRSVVSTCIDYLNGLILLQYRKNMRKMAIYCCKCSNNQSLSHFLSTSPWRSTDLLKSVRTKAIQTIGKNGVLILDESVRQRSCIRDCGSTTPLPFGVSPLWHAFLVTGGCEAHRTTWKEYEP